MSNPKIKPRKPHKPRTIDRKAEKSLLVVKAFSDTVATRARIHGVTREQASRQEGGTSIGRLWQAGRISDRDLSAAQRFGEITTANRRSWGIPDPNPQAQDLNEVRGLDDSDEDPERIKRIRLRYDEMANAAMAGKYGPRGHDLASRCIIRDEDASKWTDSEVAILRDYLARVAVHTGCA